MEEEVKSEEKPITRSKRRVSLFKKRKRADIRPFVRAKKQLRYKKFFVALSFCILGLFLLAIILYGIRMLIIPVLFNKNTPIVNPQGAMVDVQGAQSLIQSRGLDVSGLEFATNSALISFTLHNKTFVYITLEKDINAQLNLVEAIDRQMQEDNKQAITIDLRYNKPIVKF